MHREHMLRRVLSDIDEYQHVFHRENILKYLNDRTDKHNELMLICIDHEWRRFPMMKVIEHVFLSFGNHLVHKR